MKMITNSVERARFGNGKRIRSWGRHRDAYTMPSRIGPNAGMAPFRLLVHNIFDDATMSTRISVETN